MSEAFEKFREQQIHSIEGSRGVRCLENLFEALGYGEGFMRGRALEEFFGDNPGAIEAVVEWVGEQAEDCEDWSQRLEDSLEQEEY